VFFLRSNSHLSWIVQPAPYGPLRRVSLSPELCGHPEDNPVTFVGDNGCRPPMQRVVDFVHQNTFHRLWPQTQRAASIAPATWRIHSLPDAFASALISAGRSVEAVSVALGFESPTTTLNTYAGVWRGTTHPLSDRFGVGR
jgi:hypothetical protein